MANVIVVTDVYVKFNYACLRIHKALENVQRLITARATLVALGTLPFPRAITASSSLMYRPYNNNNIGLVSVDRSVTPACQLVYEDNVQEGEGTGSWSLPNFLGECN